MRHLMLVAALLVVSAACGPGGSNPPGTNPPNTKQPVVPPEESWYPLTVGSRWTYRITEESGLVYEKVRDAVSSQMRSGRRTWVLESRDPYEITRAFNQYEQNTGVWRVRDERIEPVSGRVFEVNEYEPYTLRLPPIVAGLQRSEEYVFHRFDGSGNHVKSNSKTHHWEVVSLDVEVTVPAGTFRAAHVRRINHDGSKTREFWLVKGVGKVKETADFVEELTSYHIAP